MSTVDVKQLNDYIYLMRDNEESTGYVVKGSKKALVIDTMNGTEDIKAVAQSITDLPLELLNTHGHPDHVGGNYYFGEAYMHPLDIYYAEMWMPEAGQCGRKSPMDKIKWKSILPGEQLDLGGITLEVYSLAGHTPGNIGLLERKSRVLFTGDAVNEHEWFQFDHSLPIKQCYNNLKEIETIRNEFDYILTAHGTDFIDACRLEELIAGVEEILKGKNEKDFDYEYFGGTVKAHPYGPKEEGKVIVYDPNRSME